MARWMRGAIGKAAQAQIGKAPSPRLRLTATAVEIVKDDAAMANFSRSKCPSGGVSLA